MKLIETKTLGTAAASIEFTSIPQTFTDLVVVASARNTTTSEFYRIEINGSSANFTSRYLLGNGSLVSTGSESLAPYADMARSTYTANTFSNSQFYIPNYSGSTNKSISIDSVSENNATEAYASISAGLWSQTAAVTSVLFRPNSGNFAIGCIFSLYGITKGSDGIVTTS
jgi:hypothetical protein